MFKSVFPEGHIPPVESIPPPADDRSAGASGATRDLLVMGYLSAVADALEWGGVAESRIRMGAPDRDLLHGSLVLEPIVAPGGLSWGYPLSATWDEDNGWSAELRTPAGGETARRFLHAAVVAPPNVVSQFIADLVAGRDVGMLYPATSLSHRDPGSSQSRLMADLARYAIPEVRRWLRTRG